MATDNQNTELNNIPLDVLYKHPAVQELLQKVNSNDLETSVKIPYVIKNKILMSPGVWNGYYYSNSSIANAYDKTEWDKKENRSLFLDHEDLKSHEWVGEVVNIRMSGEDMIGDLVVVDKTTAIKLAYGAKMGISPKVSGSEDEGKMVDFTFNNFSVVINPAVKTAYINNQEVSKMSEDEKKIENVPQEPQQDNAQAESSVEVENSEAAVVELLDALCTVENAGVGSLVSKAKEIKAANPEMKWADAMKEASKSMAETKENADAMPADAMPEDEPKKEEEEMSEAQILEMMVNFLKKKNLYPMPADAAPAPEEMACKKPEDKKMSEDEEEEEEFVKVIANQETKIKTQETKIQELSEKLLLVESKLNEPDKKSIKSEELSSKESFDADELFLSALMNYN